MRTSQASRTAQYMALFRAIESHHPAASRLFEDRLASTFLGPALRCAAAASRLPVVGGSVPWWIDRRWPGPRGSAVVRTRLIDDALSDALAQGVAQVAILGAGFDTRAHRIPGIGRARVLELDQPPMIAAKRARLSRRLGSIPAHLTLVPIDFNEDDLGEVLRAAGFDAEKPTFFIWEGVSQYLTPGAVDSTFRGIAAVAQPGSTVVFTYIDQDLLEHPERFGGGPQTMAAVRRAGEPFRFGFDPRDLRDYLLARGLELIDDVATVDARRRYLAPLGRDELVFGFYRVAVARVGEQPDSPAPER